MNENDIRKVLEAVEKGQETVDGALDQLRHLPFEDLGFAKIDYHRGLRQGYPEVIYGKGKTPKQVTGIVREMLGKKSSYNILITRADAKIQAAVRREMHGRGKFAKAKYYAASGTIAIERSREIHGKGLVLVVTAGTSDIPVAEEALATAQTMGNRAEAIYDIGVAGLHRLLEHRTRLTEARVIICVAGMEGALPSVIGGLVAAPVIAVPASTGYGAGAGGIAALLAMLNSCASNVAVVNIDNGFGAGCVASVINHS